MTPKAPATPPAQINFLAFPSQYCFCRCCYLFHDALYIFICCWFLLCDGFIHIFNPHDSFRVTRALLIQRRISCHLQNSPLPAISAFVRFFMPPEIDCGASVSVMGAITRTFTYRFKVLIGCCTQLFLTFPFPSPSPAVPPHDFQFALKGASN